MTEHISRSRYKSLIQFAFIVCQVEGYRSILKVSCEPLVFASVKKFFGKKNSSGISLPSSFCA